MGPEKWNVKVGTGFNWLRRVSIGWDFL